MRYLESYNYLFKSPNWGMNLLAATVAPLVPVAGQMVLLGYGYEMIETLHRFPKRRYSDFNFNRLVPYLIRGIWPFLVQFLLSLPMLLIYMATYFGFFASLASAKPGSGPPAYAWVVLGSGIMAMFVLSILMHLVSVPLSLRAGLSQDFASAFSWSFFVDFTRRVWLEEVLAGLFLFGTSLILLPAGLLLCFIGVYPAAALVTLAGYHLGHQLYELYLSRGGSPVPLKVEPAWDEPEPEDQGYFQPTND